MATIPGRLYRITFVRRHDKPYHIGLLFTHTCFRRDFCLEGGCAAPISAVECHISDRCKYFRAFRVGKKAIRHSSGIVSTQPGGVCGLAVNTSNSGSGGPGFKPRPSRCFLGQETLLHFVSLHLGV